MNYTKQNFASELREQLRFGWDVVRIARWAHAVFMEHARDLEPGLQPVIMKVVAMEEGPEFELTKRELETLAETLAASSTNSPGRRRNTSRLDS